MPFLIADTFTDSLARLTNDEQKAVKTTAFDLQLNPAHPSLQFHKLDKAKDRRFWSICVNADVRLIVHRSCESFLLCYVAHHDDAYHWAERRKLETHPATGAAQFVEVRETVHEIVVPVVVATPAPAPIKPPLFAGLTDAELLATGVPTEWLPDAGVRCLLGRGAYGGGRRPVFRRRRLGERLEVSSIDSIGRRLYESNIGRAKLADIAAISDALRTLPPRPARTSSPLIYSSPEWEQIVDAWQIETWDAYRDVARLGRKTRLKEPQRAQLWSIFDRARATLASRDLITQAELFTKASAKIAALPHPPFDFAVGR